MKFFIKIKVMLFILLAVIMYVSAAYAELRTIAIEIFASDNGAQVSIHSDVEKESKLNVSVKEAEAILKEARGWGSTVLVAIVIDDRILLNQYISILDVIAANGWLDLVEIRRRGRRQDATALILKNYKIELDQ